MKHLLTIAMLSLLTACASNPSIKTSGDIKGQETIRVIASGNTPDEAKRNGFRSAIEIVVGSVIVSEKEAYNDRLLKNQIIEHSAGYVDDFKIINKYPSGSGVTMVMDVTVKNSVIASKLLNRSEPSNINGERLDVQYKTYMEERGTGDAFLHTVLKDYPSKALNVQQGKVEYMLNGDRGTVFVIPFAVRWNYNYVKALNEALSKVQDTGSDRFFDPKCMCYISPERVVVMAKDPKDWLIGSKNTYHFNDSVRAKNIASYLSSKPYVKISFISHSGRKLQENCVGSDYVWAGVRNSGLFEVWGNVVEEGRITVEVRRGTPLHKDMDSLNRIETTMVASDKCNS